eukprot:TRINITY_DN32042_c0_g1_i1.p1 TRINITY_DN32042_c0_g1~~TRINITY_DN32042_c0_g1_i1.p1  ORF type:complete len:419 (+),score=84.58 TRINITY_DN32042_c0_g1_i1:66-1322(+)
MEAAAVWIIYALVVLYALCYQFQRPIEPFLVDRLVKGAGEEATVALGRVEAFFNVAQGIGSLIMGRVLDRFGVKVGLVINFLACAAQYSILSMTDSLNMLFLSKLPGMMMGGFLCAQTAIAKVTADEGDERVVALGRLTSSYTLGGLFGPFLGGLLGSTGDYFFGAKLAAAGSLFAVGLVFLLPAGLDAKGTGEKEKDAEGKPDTSESWFSQVVLLLGLAGPLLATKVVTGLANNMARSAQPVIFKNDLGFDEAMMGSMMSGQFAFGGLANAFMLAPLSAFLGGKMDQVVRNCVLVMGIVYAIMAALFAPSLYIVEPSSTAMAAIYIGLSLFLSVFQFLLATSITAKTQTLVPKALLGSLMGLEHSIFAFAGMIGPLIGTSVFTSYGLSGLCSLCAVSFFSTLVALPRAAGAKAEKAC